MWVTLIKYTLQNMSIFYTANSSQTIYYNIVLNVYKIVLKVNTKHFYNNDESRAKVILYNNF